MGSVVLNILSSDNLDPKSKDLRDQCLEHLEDHIHDIHAFVRCKVSKRKCSTTCIAILCMAFDNVFIKTINFGGDILLFPCVSISNLL